MEIPAMMAIGRRTDLVGLATSASEGIVGMPELGERPIFRPGEIIETIPGVIATQHAGGGKANQFFLRGFNLDHGTDLLTSLEGMPINQRSHAHGQGYTDLNILIPELVREVRYRKGPYYADVGDFGSAGAFDLELWEELPSGLVSIGGGTLGFARLFVGDSFQAGAGTALYGLELEHTDGPWANEDDFQKLNAVVRYGAGDAENGWNLMAMAYKSHWDSSDQMARRAWDRGFPFYDSADPTTGGESQRYSLLWNWRRTDSRSATKALLYGSYSDLDLFSNFTYFLDDPENGDQFEQKERRTMLGGQLSHTFFGSLLGGKSDTTFGLQMRHDDLRAGLWHTRERNRLETTRYDRIRETNLSAYAENKTQWTSWFRTVAGVRGDYFVFDNANGTGGETGREGDFIASPKLNLIFGPWAKTEVYLSGGLGFHSNDARGVTDRFFPADPLVRTQGAEVGLRTTALPGLQSTLALWVLDIDSELIFVGDAGVTEAGRESRRWGLEWANYYDINKYLTLDADIAWSQARFRDVLPEGQRVPGSIETVASAGLTVHDLGPWFGALRMRYFGPRDLVEDGSARSNSTLLFNAQAGYKFNDTWSITVEVFNLLNSEDSDIDYFYTSRLPGEPLAGVDDFHSHPVEPRALRVTVSAKF
jgi:hypothetical protein